MRFGISSILSCFAVIGSTASASVLTLESAPNTGWAGDAFRVEVEVASLTYDAEVRAWYAPPRALIFQFSQDGQFFRMDGGYFRFSDRTFGVASSDAATAYGGFNAASAVFGAGIQNYLETWSGSTGLAGWAAALTERSELEMSSYYLRSGSEDAVRFNHNTEDIFSGATTPWLLASSSSDFRIDESLDPGNPGTGSEADPILPDTTSGDGSFVFQDIFQEDSEVRYYDPEVAIGYTFESSGESLFDSFVLPELGDGSYELLLWDENSGSYSVEAIDVKAQETFVFDVPVASFKIMGIELSEMINPSDPTAFVIGLSFDKTGLLQFTQTPIVAETEAVPIPAAAWLIGGVLALQRLCFSRRGARRISSKSFSV